MHPDLWLPQRHRIMNTLSSYSAAHAGVARERETVRCLLNILVSWLLMLPLLVLTFPALVTVSHVRICACACCHALAAKCLLGILCLMSDMLTGVSQVHNAMCVMPAAPRPGQQRPCMFSASCCLIRKWCVFQVVLGKQMSTSSSEVAKVCSLISCTYNTNPGETLHHRQKDGLCSSSR
jgi:hypothetical protein